MNFGNYKIKYIKEEEFLSYTDWLTRFKDPFSNLLRVSEKIITKNCIAPKFNIKQYQELDFITKIELTKYIWKKSLQNLLGQEDFSQNKLKNFLIYEEQQTFDTDFLLSGIEEVNITDYRNLREYLFLPIDELITYFTTKPNKPVFLKRLIEKQQSPLAPDELYKQRCNYASIKLLFLVEGITEETILPIFAKTMDIDFEKYGIKLKSAGGKTHLLKYYADIRNSLKIPVFILLDADGVDILDDLNNILKPKDYVYLISNGEIEDILSHELIIRSINNYYSMQGSICSDDLNKNQPMIKTLYNLYKEKGFGEFHKAKFAQILKENIQSQNDASMEIKKILTVIQNKLASHEQASPQQQ